MNPALVQLEEILPELPAAVERRRFGEVLGKTAEALKDSAHLIDRLEAALQIAREIHFDAEKQQAATLQELIGTCEVTADIIEKAKTPDDLRLVQDTYRELLAALVQAERQLRLYWRRIVERDFAPLRAVGELLEKIDRNSDLGKRLSTCGREAEQMSDRLPIPAMRDAIVHLQREREELEAERVSLTQEPEVDRFLNALAAGTATLQTVSSRVQKWLEKYDALDRFMVTPRS